jgi:hypothetical protein
MRSEMTRGQRKFRVKKAIEHIRVGALKGSTLGEIVKELKDKKFENHIISEAIAADLTRDKGL